MNREHTIMLMNMLRDKANCIILECDKWKNNPEAIFKHGYAREKAEMIIGIIERGEEE